MREEVRANCVRNAKEFELLNPLSEVLMNGSSLKLKETRFLGERQGRAREGSAEEDWRNPSMKV